MNTTDQAGQAPSAGGPIFHLQEYYFRLSQGDRNNIARTFRGLPLISDPRYGDVRDWGEYEDYVGASAAWLQRRSARFTPGESLPGTAFHILEGWLDLDTPQPPARLGVILVGEVFAGGIRRLRIYHNPAADSPPMHRRAALPPNPAVKLPGSIAALVEALAAGEQERLGQIFVPPALAAPGADFPSAVLQPGHQALAGPWQVCTLTSTGSRHILEYNMLDSGGYEPLPGGCAVITLEPGGRIERLAVYQA